MDEQSRPSVDPREFRVKKRTQARSTAQTFDGTLSMIPGVELSLRSMLVDSDAGKVLISPVGTVAEQEAVGVRLSTVVAPSLLHHKFLADAIDRYHPEELWGPPGLSEKRPELRSIHEFGKAPWPYEEAMPYVLIEGAPMRNEIVFFHRATRTLYTADLFFNILQPKGALTPITYRLMGIYKRFAMPRMWKSWVKDETAFKRSIAKMLSWDFDRVVMAHGEVVESDGKALVGRALRERKLLP